MNRHSIVSACACLAAFCLSGCVRTADGSIEPRYAPTIERVGPVPVVMMRPARREPSETLTRRPVPTPVPQMTEISPPPASGRRAAAAPPPGDRDTRLLACGPAQAAGGRVRMECR